MLERAGSGRSLLDRGGFGLLVFVVGTVLAFDVLPAVRLLFAALAPSGVLAPERAWEVITSRSAVRATVATLESSSASALIALAIGATMALTLGITDARARRGAAFL